MASPSVTYSFINGQTSDGPQVSQNFTDLIAGITDGTKDLAINALTLNGALIAKGTVQLGDSNSDTIDTQAYFINNLIPSTTNTRDIGTSSLKWKDLYLAGNATVGGTLAITGTTTLATGLTGVVKAVSGVISASSLVNADVSASAAIAYSKLTLTGSIVDADVSGSAAISGSKIVAATTSTIGVVTASSQSISGVKTMLDGCLIKGLTAGSHSATGNVGQVIASDFGNASVGTTNQYKSLGSIALTAGNWVVFGQVYFNANGGTVTKCAAAISTNDNNTVTDHVAGKNEMEAPPCVAAYDMGVSVNGVLYTLSGSQTTYLKGKAVYSVATPVFRGTISAVRIS